MRLLSISAALAVGLAASAAAQGGAPPPANMHSTVPPGTAAGVNNSISPSPSVTPGTGADAHPAVPGGGSNGALGADASSQGIHAQGGGRGTAATAGPTGTDAGMRGRQAPTGAVNDFGDPPSDYPVCRNRAQDRCRVR